MRNEMLTGWIHHKHKLNRPLSETEIEERLDRSTVCPVAPCERMSLLRLNSVYAEFIDGRFLGREYPTLMGLIFLPFFLLGPLWAVSPLVQDWLNGQAQAAEISIALFVGFLGLLLAFFVWKPCIKPDVCTYTHYPIRFNRKARMIYVFRSADDVLAVHWEKAFFFIGRGEGGEKRRFELRCHVLNDNEMIVDTFGVGNDSSSPGAILQLWEMIRLYMEEGPRSLPRYLIQLFPRRVTWEESWLLMSAKVASIVGTGNMVWTVITAPFWGIATIMHYFVLKTCQTPIWPRDVEDVCRFEPNDPYQLMEVRCEATDPRYHERVEAELARLERNEEAVRAWEETKRKVR